MMALILLLIVAVAAFNIVAMLVMVVNDKRTDIAILRTFGASPRSGAAHLHDPGPGHRLVRRRAGASALGVLLARNVDAIVPLLERLFGFQFLRCATSTTSPTHSIGGAGARRAVDQRPRPCC